MEIYETVARFRCRYNHYFFCQKLFCLATFLCIHFAIQAQKEIILCFRCTDMDDLQCSKLDSVKCQQTINTHLLELLSEGYTFANLDATSYRNDTCFAFIFKGSKYRIGKISLTKTQEAILEASGVRNHLNKNLPIDSNSVNKYLRTLVAHQNKIGFPFARVAFDSVYFIQEKMYAKLKIDKGRYITFDSILQEGRMILNPNIAKRLLEIKRDRPYNHEKVLGVKAKLRNLSYAQQRIDPYVRFINDKAHLILTLDPRPASRFDFLVGVLPQVKEGIRKWNLTVDFTTELNNSFGLGEYSFVQLKRLQAENLELQLKSTIPYIFNLPIGSHFDFRIFKNANQNIDLFFDGGMQYLFGGFNQLKILTNYRSSSLIEVDKDLLLATKRLPARLDVSYFGGGIGLQINNLDYRFNPKKGFALELNTTVGNKKINPNRQILDIPEFERSYDTLRLNTLQVEMDGNISFFQQVNNWSTIKIGSNIGLKYNQESIFTNELMRIGGSKLLRGFDEESIFTDFYTFATLEFRIVFDQNSYISLPFIDYGFTQIVVDNKRILDRVFGLGMGLNFGTSAGVFNLSFAAGSNRTSPLDFSRMKIHFGYVNLF